MLDDIVVQVLEAKGPIVLVVMPHAESASNLDAALRDQYKDMASGSPKCRIRLTDGREIDIISTHQSGCGRGRLVNDLIFHPSIIDQRVYDALLPCLI
jgi:hypothetical protein